MAQKHLLHLRFWSDFQCFPRMAIHVPGGVLEQMPIANAEYYCSKYVNGHPGNPQVGLPSIVALGIWADSQTGIPLMFCDMTLLTAIRTAVVSAIASQYGAVESARVVGVIGCGAQAAFQIEAHHVLCGFNEFIIYDIDPQAMEHVQRHFVDGPVNIQAADGLSAVVAASDVLITITAAKEKQSLLAVNDLKPGLHINGLGGDCPGKTEFSQAVLSQTTIVTDYLAQAVIEGEIQQLDDTSDVAELWQCATGEVTFRQSPQAITFFDGVGFALQDFSACQLLYELAQEQGIEDEPFLPPFHAAKDWYGLLHSS